MVFLLHVKANDSLLATSDLKLEELFPIFSFFTRVSVFLLLQP